MEDLSGAVQAKQSQNQHRPRAEIQSALLLLTTNLQEIPLSDATIARNPKDVFYCLLFLFVSCRDPKASKRQKLPG